MGKFVLALSMFAITSVIAAQTIPGRATSSAPPRDRSAEEQVAKKLESMRQSAGLPSLKRVSASVEEVQLTCTAALTGKQVHDPMFGSFSTYATDDLNAEASDLRLVALGTTTYSDGSSRRVYSDKGWPYYSVVVFQDKTTGQGRIIYRIGIARRQTGLMEFIGPFSADHPINDRNDWKRQVNTACRHFGSR